MVAMRARTPEGGAATDVVLATFRASGLLLTAGNQLAAEALVQAGDNLDHRRSPLIALTEAGSQKYAAVDRRQIRWINELSAGLKLPDLEAAARLLHDLSDRLEITAQTGRRRDDDNDAP